MKNMINEKEVKTFLKKSYKYPLSISKKAKMQIDNNVRFVTRIKSIGKNGMLKILGLGFDRKWFRMSLGVIASVLVLIGSFWIFSNINGDKENVNKVKAEIFVTSTSASSLGITEQSGFVVKVGADVSSEKIAENIEIYPPIEYKVEIENGTLSVIPNDNLLPDTIYSIKLAQGTELSEGSVLEDEMLWMFVTEPTLNLITTYPLDLSTNVAVSDEIVFEFSRFDLDLQSFEDNFTITPDVEGKFYKLGNKIKFVPNESLIGGISYEVRLNKDFSANSGKSLQEETVITFVTDSNGNKDNVYVNLNDGCFSNLNNSDLSISFVNNYSTCVISSNTGRINVKAYELPTSLLGDLTEYALLVNNLGGVMNYNYRGMICCGVTSICLRKVAIILYSQVILIPR